MNQNDKLLSLCTVYLVFVAFVEGRDVLTITSCLSPES
jgi:hypothetical protein